MSVAFDSAVTRTQSNASSDSWSHTCTGSDRYVVVAVGWGGASGCTASVTYDGVSMTNLGVATNASYGSSVQGKAQLFGLANPPTGAKTVALTFSAAGNYGGAVSVSYTGVDGTTSTGSIVTATGASAVSHTATVTDGATGDMVVDALSLDTGGSSPVAGKTSRLNVTSTGYSGCAQDTAGGASVGMDWTWTGTTSYAHAAINLKQVAAPASAALSGSAGTTGSGTAVPNITIGL